MAKNGHAGRIRFGAVLGLLVIIIVVAVAIKWRIGGSRHAANPLDKFAASATPQTVSAGTERRIRAFCGDCHAVPRPESFPRRQWHTEVRIGFEYYTKAGRTDLEPPAMADVVAYYQARAPEHLEFSEPPDADKPMPVHFRVTRVPLPGRADVDPAVAHLRWMSLADGADPELIVTDMRQGTIMAVPIPVANKKPRLLATLRNPCHVEPCDLDNDGYRDLLVADLGSFPPADHDRGRVIWLRRRGAKESYETRVLATGLGRVADVRPADVDNDGDIDIITAVFGMNRTGGIVLLRNVTQPGAPVAFDQELIDRRPGTIHVPPHDFNGDGHIDFAALISQETEQVALFMNSAGSTHQERPFHLKSLWAAPDLTFGSSCLQLVDLDADQDMDLLFTNGDTFDNSFVNPSHGVQWLENKGGLEFEYHRLTDLVGAYVNAAGDFDQDGDLDVLVGTWLPEEIKPVELRGRSFPSVVFLEQTTTGSFARHTLERDETLHAVLEVADFDGDGDLDFVTGCHTLSRTSDLPYWLAIWWNEPSSN